MNDMLFRLIKRFCTYKFAESTSCVAMISEKGVSIQSKGSTIADFPLFQSSCTTDRQFPETPTAELRISIRKATRGQKHTKVVLANEFLYYFTTTPFANSRSLTDSKDAALLRFKQLYPSENPFDWIISADWSIERPFISCAAPIKLVEYISHIFETNISDIVPQFIQDWNASISMLSEQTWLMTTNDREVYLGVHENGYLSQIRYYRSPTNIKMDKSWIVNSILRDIRILGLNIPENLAIQYRDGTKAIMSSAFFDN